jgi:signal transduction histidine kinase
MNVTEPLMPKMILSPTLDAGDRPTSRLVAPARTAVWLALVGLAYALGARLSLTLIFHNSQLGLLWAANAVLVSALILSPRRSWVSQCAVVAVAHLLIMHYSTAPWRMAWQISTHLLFAVATTEVMRRWIGFPVRFERGRDVLRYTAIAVTFPVLLSLVSPAFVLSAIGVERVFSPGIAFLRIALANVTPLLLLTPAILLCAQFGQERAYNFLRQRRIEAALVIVSVLVTGAIAFTGPDLGRYPWLLLLTFPPLIWAAVRLGPAGASLSLVCVASLSIWGAARTLGPFILRVTPDVALSLQIYWIVIGPPVMLLAATIRERESAEASLHEQRSQLTQVMRVATAGEFSMELAHELRQPMQSILANARAGLQLLATRPDDHSLLREILEDIVQQDQQASKVVARLRAAVKGGASKLEPVALESVVSDALALTRHVAEHARVNVQAEIPQALPLVRADRIQLLQVLVNLVANGCESMTAVPNVDRVLTLRVAQAAPDRLEVSVADSGVGLPVGGQDQVFEPFFTTKDAGLGLGLSISRSIAVAHGGRLWAENNESHRGATFHLQLPTALTALSTPASRTASHFHPATPPASPNEFPVIPSRTTS